jgi:hypothetical protein
LIVTADNEAFALSSMAAVREGPRLKPPISQRESEELLNKLVADNWLMKRRSVKVQWARKCIDRRVWIWWMLTNLLQGWLLCVAHAKYHWAADLSEGNVWKWNPWLSYVHGNSHSWREVQPRSLWSTIALALCCRLLSRTKQRCWDKMPNMQHHLV